MAFSVMRNQLSLHAHSYHSILLIVPAISVMAFAGCSSVGGTGETRSAPTMLTEAAAKHGSGAHVTVGPSTYNTETMNFDRPWPFGPESNSQ